MFVMQVVIKRNIWCLFMIALIAIIHPITLLAWVSIFEEYGYSPLKHFLKQDRIFALGL